MVIVLLSIILVSYILGSIPSAYIFGKVLRGVDIRKYGSGNVGATNVFRTIGKFWGITVLVIDFLKGYIAVKYVPEFVAELFNFDLNSAKYVLIFAGAFAIVGHIWTVFLRFKGGKGVATSAGVVCALAPNILLVCLAIFALVFSLTKIVSISSLVSAASMPLVALIFSARIEIVIFFSVLTIVATFSHRSNIKRLIRGEEKKLI